MLKTNSETRFPWQAVAAAASLFSCLAAGFFGTLLTTGWIMDAHLHPSLRGFGLLLLILLFPLLLLSGHFLDLLEQKRKGRTRDAA